MNADLDGSTHIGGQHGRRTEQYIDAFESVDLAKKSEPQTLSRPGRVFPFASCAHALEDRRRNRIFDDVDSFWIQPPIDIPVMEKLTGGNEASTVRQVGAENLVAQKKLTRVKFGKHALHSDGDDTSHNRPLVWII